MHMHVTTYILNQIINKSCKFRPNEIHKSIEVCTLIKQRYQCQQSLKDILMKIVFDSRSDKYIETSSAAAITILNILQIDFSKMDLSQISIPYAIFTNTSFYSTNFQSSNLSNVIFNKCHIKYTKFNGADMRGINFGITQSLSFPEKIKCMDIDTSGKYITIGGRNGQLIIYQIKTGKNIYSFNIGKKVSQIKYSFDSGRLFIKDNQRSIYVIDTSPHDIINLLEIHIRTIIYPHCANCGMGKKLQLVTVTQALKTQVA